MLNWLDTLNAKPWVRTSERHLREAHETVALKLKRFKRIFIQKGEMMKTFDHINRLHDSKNYKGIQRVIRMLYRDMPPHWMPRYHKYKELIRYCQFLEDIRFANGVERANLIEDLRNSLDMGHEVGVSIYEHTLSKCRY